VRRMIGLVNQLGIEEGSGVEREQRSAAGVAAVPGDEIAVGTQEVPGITVGIEVAAQELTLLPLPPWKKPPRASTWSPSVWSKAAAWAASAR